MHLPTHIEVFFLDVFATFFFWGGIYSPHQWLEIAWFLGLKKKTVLLLGFNFIATIHRRRMEIPPKQMVLWDPGPVTVRFWKYQ